MMSFITWLVRGFTGHCTDREVDLHGEDRRGHEQEARGHFVVEAVGEVVNLRLVCIDTSS